MKSAFVSCWVVGLLAGAAFGGISVDPDTGWSVVDRSGYAFAADTSAKPYAGLVIHGDSTVSANTMLTNCNHSQTLALAPDSGDAATVTISNKATLGNATAGQRGLFFIGENGGWGSLQLYSSVLQFYELRVCENAAVPDADENGDAPAVLTVGQNGSAPTVNMHFIANENARPVRIVFAGGSISHSDGGGGAWFYPNKGDIVVEAKNGNPIRMQSGGHSLDGLGIGGHTLRIKGDGALVWNGSNDSGNGGQLKIDSTTSNGCTYDMTYTGNTIVYGVNSAAGTPAPALIFNAGGYDNWFPIGADKGDLELRSYYPNSPTWVNLSGTSHELNGLVGVKCTSGSYTGADKGVVSNRSATASVLTVGKYRDGQIRNMSIRGRTDYANNLVVKQQGHLMTLENVDIEDYRLKSGDLTLGKDCRFAHLTLANGSTVTADGATVTLTKATLTDNGAIYAACNGGQILLDDGGQITVLAVDLVLRGGATNVWQSAVMLPDDGHALLRKTGAGFLNYEPIADAKGNGLAVEGGVLRFGGEACADEFWRLTVKGAKPMKTVTFPDGPVAASLGIGTVGLFDTSGLNVADGMKDRGVGVAATSLNPGEVTTEKPYFPTSNATYKEKYPGAGDNPLISGASCTTLAYAFDTHQTSNTYDIANIGTWWGGVVYTNRTPVASDPETWERLVWRKRAATPPVCCYGVAPLTNIGNDLTQMTDWLVESSADGVTWTARDERRGQTEYVAISRSNPAERYGYNGHLPYFLTTGKASWSFNTFGTVSVAAGARLDLDEIPDANISFASLEVDMTAGGGAISAFSPAETWELRLTRANAADFSGPMRKPCVELPITFERVLRPENLPAGTLFVNGTRTEDVRIMLSPVTGKVRFFPGIPQDAPVDRLGGDRQTLEVDAGSFDPAVPLLESAGIISAPEKLLLAFSGFAGNVPTERFVVARAAAFDLPENFGGWTFSPTDGEHAFEFAVEGNEIVAVPAPAPREVYYEAQGQCIFTGFGGVTFVPNVNGYVAGASQSYAIENSFKRDADGGGNFRMTCPGNPDLACHVGFVQKDARTVTIRYSVVPEADVETGVFRVYMKPSVAAVTGGFCVRTLPGGTTKTDALPLAKDEGGQGVAAGLTEFYDREGVKRMSVGGTEGLLGVKLYKQLDWQPANMRVDFYRSSSHALLKGGDEYVIELDVSAEEGRQTRFYPSGVTVSEDPQWMRSEPVQRVVAGSALDLSAFRPGDGERAGAHGRVVRVDDHFEFAERPGEPVRFMGANISSLPASREIAERFACDMARRGYNIIRLHMFQEAIVANTGDESKCTLNAAAADQFDWLVDALVRHGLYMTTDLYVKRTPSWRSIGYDRDGEMEMNEFKFLLYVSEPAQSNLMKFVKALFTHRNPYTGLTLAEEPAMAFVSTVNEGGLMLSPPNAVALTDEFRTQWEAWLEAKKQEDPANYGDVPSEIPANYTDTKGGWAYSLFVQDRQRRLFSRLHALMHDELNCPVPMTANMNADFRTCAFELLRNELNEYVDGHYYIDHPNSFDKDSSGGVPFKLGNGNVNMMGTADYGAPFVVRHRHLDRPYCVTEYNYVAPSSRRGGGSLITGALAGLQGWSSLIRHDWGALDLNDSSPRQKKLNCFSLANDPLNLASECVAAALYQRGDIARLSRTYGVNLPPENLKRPIADVAKKLNDMPNRWSGWYARAGVQVGDSLPAGVISGGEWPAPLADTKEKVMGDLGLASGGEMPLAGDGQVQIFGDRIFVSTARTLGGFAENGQITAGGGALTADVGVLPAAVWAISLDGRDIRASRHLLVSHLTDLQSSDIAYMSADRTKLIAFGNLPHLVRVAQADVTLALGEGVCEVWALNMDGSRKCRVPARKSAGRLSFTADVAVGGDTAVLLYEIERRPPTVFRAF